MENHKSTINYSINEALHIHDVAEADRLRKEYPESRFCPYCHFYVQGDVCTVCGYQFVDQSYEYRLERGSHCLRTRKQELLTNELFRSLNGICHECGDPGELDNDFRCERCSDLDEVPETCEIHDPSTRKEMIPSWLITVIACVFMIVMPPITS